MGEFFGMVLTTAGIIGLLGAFASSDQTQFPEDWNKAVSLCENNGGLKKASADVRDVTATCINGAVFEFVKGSELKKENK